MQLLPRRFPFSPIPKPYFSYFPTIFSSSSSSSTSTEKSPPRARSRTPSAKQFDSWIKHLQPGFTASDLAAAIQSASSDPDLSLNLLRWAPLNNRGFRPSAACYLAALRSLLSGRRFSAAVSLIDDALSGACPPDTELYNAIIHFCCSRRHLFSQAFDTYKKMLRAGAGCRPSIETYSMLLAVLVRRFGKPPVSYVYLHSVKSLVRQMKASGLAPDALAMNLIIKAYSRCLEMEEAIRVFKEMRLYGCEPNAYSYGYIVKGLCEKEKVEEGFRYFKEMREKGLVPTGSVYAAVICSLAMVGEFELGVTALFDMLENGMKPDILTYRTVLEGICRDGKSEEAFKLLEDLSNRPCSMPRRMYSDLLSGLHWLCQTNSKG